MNILDNLKSIGYDVAVNNGNIKLLFIGDGVPDENRVRPLLEELKANKSKIIEEFQKDKVLKPIPDDTLLDIYHKAMDKINTSYITGTTKYIQEHNKQLDTEINKTDDRVNEVWHRCNKGEASLKDFEDALNTYQALYLKAIDIKKNTILPTVEKLCVCGSRAIPYEDSSGNHIFDKCNVHDARLKVTHADIDEWTRERD
jgi:hypothetical protein